MYNMSVVNPGYVIPQNGMVSTGILYRKQWMDIKGAPATINLFAHIPLLQRIQVSINYIGDKIGDEIKVKNDFFNADVSYIMDVSESLQMAFGIKAGINNFRLDPSEGARQNHPQSSP